MPYRQQQATGRQVVQAAASYANGGLAIAYVMAVVNAAVGALVSFGVDLSTAQSAAVVGLVNATLVAALHLLAMFKTGRAFGPPAPETPPPPPVAT